MTIIDRLIAEKGYKRQKINAQEKLILDIVSLIAPEEETQAAIEAAEYIKAQYTVLLRSCAERDAKLREKERELWRQESIMARIESNLNVREKAVAEKEQRYKAANTDEARDRLILADYFKENTKIETGWDRSAYITGLAAILSGQPIEQKEMEKGDANT